MPLPTGHAEGVHGPSSPSQGVWVQLVVFREHSVKEANGWLVLEMQLPNPCPEPLSQAPAEIFLQTVTGRWQDGHRAGD